MRALEALRKITVKEILKGKVPRDKDSKVIDQDLCLVYGRIINHRVGNTAFGDFVEYAGTFEGKRLCDTGTDKNGGKKGETFQAARLILPPPASDIVFAAYSEAKADDDQSIIQIALVIGVEFSERGTEGYRFTCRPLPTGADTVDPLAALRETLTEEAPELMALGTVPATQQLEGPKSEDKLTKAKNKTDPEKEPASGE